MYRDDPYIDEFSMERDFWNGNNVNRDQSDEVGMPGPYSGPVYTRQQIEQKERDFRNGSQRGNPTDKRLQLNQDAWGQGPLRPGDTYAPPAPYSEPYSGPDYSKQQHGMGGGLDRGYYSGPLDGVYKYGEGPLAKATQQFLDDNPNWLSDKSGGTSSTQSSGAPKSKWGKVFDTVATVGGGVASTGILGGNGSDTVRSGETMVKNPWSVAAPYMADVLQQSQDLYRSGQGSEYYPGQSFQQMGSDTSTGYNQMRDRAMGGSQTQNLANQNVQQMMQGGINPQLDAMYDRGSQKITDSMKSMGSKAGRYGSHAVNDATGEALGDFATSLYGGAYGQDQNNRLNAINMAGGVAQNDYADSQRLLGIGQGVEGYQTAERNADMNRWNFNNQNPYDRLGQYGNMASNMGGMGGTTTGNVTKSVDPGLTSIFGDVGSIAGEVDNIWGNNQNTGAWGNNNNNNNNNAYGYTKNNRSGNEEYYS